MKGLSLNHDAVDDLLGAFVDGELPETVASQIQVHLGECERCRQAVAAQVGIRDRLAGQPVSPASAALRESVTQTVRHGRRAQLVPWLGWAMAAVLAAVLVWGGSAANSLEVAVASRPPMVEEALADYRRLIAGELPLERIPLSEVQSLVSFPVVPLDSSEARLIGVWTTRIVGEPAAVLAYRRNDQVLLQYAVSEKLFFTPAQVRQAVAAQGQYLVSSGRQTVMAWPEIHSGSILVSDLSPSDLTPLRS